MMARQTKSTAGNARTRKSLATSRARQPLKPRANPRRGLIVFGCCVFALLGMLVVKRDNVAAFVNRPITKVRMENPWNRVSAAEIRSLLAGHMGQGFFEFNVAAVQDDLEAHPWIAGASVQRLWPDSLALFLEEEVPIARWGDSGVLNQRAEVFVPPEVDSLASLPHLVGPAGSQMQVMQQYQAINEQLFPAGLRLSKLELSSRGSWNITINNEFEIAVGRTQILDRLQRFLRFYEAEPAMRTATIKSADLRYGNGVAIAFKNEELAEIAASQL